jgi:hypothetical protein
MKHAAHESHDPGSTGEVSAPMGSRERHGASGSHPYRLLGWMTLGMFLVMYALMYAMVDRFAHVYHSLNQVYMAALMTGAMVLLEVLVMRHMYPDRSRNVVVVALSLLVLGVSWFGIRQQWGVGDRQFLRSMIPHHSGAILMCGNATVTDARIRALCGEIESSQQREIALMQQLLTEPDTASR